MIVHTIAGGINKNAPHPNAAKLFMNFLLSEEGQSIYQSQNRQPTRRGIAASWLPKNVKFHVNNPDIGDKVADYQKLFGEIFSAK
jgi:ABC-type Fe3+ transport system substrate-binding protein